MLPSRERALKGMDYTPKNYSEIQAEQDLFLKKKTEEVKVDMWRMDAAKYTQVQVTYRGNSSIVCIADDAPSNDPDDIRNAILNFYRFVDLEKTAIFKKASANDKPRSNSNECSHSPGRKVDIDNRKKGSRRVQEDEGLTVLGVDCNNTIFKERAIQVFAYAAKRAKDESLTAEERKMFSTNDVHDDIFMQVYRKQSQTTVRNKTTATLRYMAKQGWLKQCPDKSKLMYYEVINNPYINEMPAQAEFNSEEQKNTMRIELDAMRRNEDGPKC